MRSDCLSKILSFIHWTIGILSFVFFYLHSYHWQSINHLLYLTIHNWTTYLLHKFIRFKIHPSMYNKCYILCPKCALPHYFYTCKWSISNITSQYILFFSTFSSTSSPHITNYCIKHSKNLQKEHHIHSKKILHSDDIEEAAPGLSNSYSYPLNQTEELLIWFTAKNLSILYLANVICHCRSS